MNSPIVCQYIPAIQNLGQAVIVEKDRQNGRERKSSKLFYELLISHLKTNNFDVPRQ